MNTEWKRVLQAFHSKTEVIAGPIVSTETVLQLIESVARWSQEKFEDRRKANRKNADVYNFLVEPPRQSRRRLPNPSAGC